MDNEDLYWDDINDYEQIPCWDENGELPDDDDYRDRGNRDDRRDRRDRDNNRRNDYRKDYDEGSFRDKDSNKFIKD